MPGKRLNLRGWRQTCKDHSKENDKNVPYTLRSECRERMHAVESSQVRLTLPTAVSSEDKMSSGGPAALRVCPSPTAICSYVGGTGASRSQGAPENEKWCCWSNSSLSIRFIHSFIQQTFPGLPLCFYPSASAGAAPKIMAEGWEVQVLILALGKLAVWP